MKILFAVILFGAAISLASSEITDICGSNLDLECIRNYFSENGDCSVISKANKRPRYHEADIPIFLPSIETTAVITEIALSNLNGQWEKFFKDEDTGNLVMSVNFPAANGSAPETVFAISRTGQEPIVFTDYAKASYPVTLTAVIPCDGEITVECLKEAQYSGHFTSNDADIAIGPKFTDSQNPVIQETLMELFANVPTILKELFLTKAEFFFLAYLQNYVCDFDLFPVLNRYDLTTLSSINEVNTDDQPKFRPCADSDDMTNCARDYFEEQGACSVVRKPDNSPVHRGLFYDYAPILNMTIELDNSEFSGLDGGEILDLYVNEESQNLVVSLVIDNVIKNSPDAKAIFNRKGQQPLVIEVPVVSNFSMVTITAVIPIRDGLTTEAVKKAFVGATVGDGGFDIGSAFLESQDPTVLEAIQILGTQLKVVIKEVFITEAYSYFNMFLQKNICDFGIEPTYFPY